MRVQRPFNNESTELTSIEDSDGRGLPSQVPINVSLVINLLYIL